MKFEQMTWLAKMMTWLSWFRLAYLLLVILGVILLLGFLRGTWSGIIVGVFGLALLVGGIQGLTGPPKRATPRPKRRREPPRSQ